MDIRQAQQNYDLALKDYESSMSTPSLYADSQGNVKTSAGVRPSAYGGFGGNDAWSRILHTSQYKPIQMGGNANRSGLDAARQALQEAQGLQQSNMQRQYGKLTGQASDALYGGVLGYNPKPLTAMGGQQFAAPQGNLQTPFSNMQGLLGHAQRPQMMQAGQMGGMGDMMQPKMRMY